MNTQPWNIIGWGILWIIGAWALMVCIHAFCRIFFLIHRAWWEHHQHILTRDTPPEKGQIWKQGDGLLQIGTIFDNGNISIYTGRHKNISWGEAPETWKKRVYSRKLYLTNP